MRRFLIMCTVSICPLTAILAHAQAQYPQNNGWEVIRSCVGNLPSSKIPRDQWDFEGVIFSENEDGIRAIRTDVPTSYFVAFDSGTSFASAGAFSPDGRWFAYPVGSTNWYVNSVGDNLYGVDSIFVVSTEPQGPMYQVPWDDLGYGWTASRALTRVEWINNDQFVAYGGMEGGGGVVNAFTAEFTPWEQETSLSDLSLFSPDFTRAIFHQYEETSGLYDVENDMMLAFFEATDTYFAWMPDASGFVMAVLSDAEGGSSTSSQLDIFDRNGQYVETISSLGGFAGYAVFSPDGHKLAFTADLRLFVADLVEKQVRDYCLDELGIELWFTNIVRWSPDGNTLAFYYDGYPVLLNTETLKMEILQYETGTILGWYSLQ